MISRPAVVVLGDVVGCRGAAETMHRQEADGVLIEHRLEHAAHGAFLGPDLDPMRLLVPEVAAIGAGDGAGVLLGIGPCRHPLDGAGLVDDPFPRDDALLARLLQQPVDALHFAARHRGIRPRVNSL